jgi:hypothetical protein
VTKCVLCGSKSKERTGVYTRQSARPETQPQSIALMLAATGNLIESVACNSCNQYCKGL